MRGLIEFSLLVVAFLIASRAVHGWRDLLVLVTVSALVIWPVKLIGASVTPLLAEDALRVAVSDTGHWKISFRSTDAVLLSIIIAAVLMLVTDEVLWRLQARREGGSP